MNTRETIFEDGRQAALSGRLKIIENPYHNTALMLNWERGFRLGWLESGMPEKAKEILHERFKDEALTLSTYLRGLKKSVAKANAVKARYEAGKKY